MRLNLRFSRVAIPALLPVLALSLWVAGCSPKTGENKTASQPPKASASPTTASASDATVAELSRIRGLTNPAERSRAFGVAFRQWLERDLTGAIAYLRTLSRQSAEYTQGLGLALEWLTTRDPDQALSLALELATGPAERPFFNAVFAAWAAKDVNLAVQRLGRIPASAVRENALRAVAETWAQRDFGAALTWAKSLPADERNVAVESVLVNLMYSDPLQAIQIAQQSLTGASLERTLGTALHRLLATDPAAAGSIVALLPSGDLQTATAADVAKALAVKDPRAALDWARSLTGNSRAQTLATARALEAWASQDGAGASQYVLGLTSEAERKAAALAVADVYGRQNPSAAIAWAQGLANSDTREATLARVTDSWARTDGGAAARWITEQETTLGTQAPTALNGALSYWALQDTAGAEEFVRTLPASSQASAAAFLAPLLAQTHPESTLEWAQSLSDPSAQTAALTAAYKRWQNNAPAAATAWLDQAKLAPSVKANLLAK